MHNMCTYTILLIFVITLSHPYRLINQPMFVRVFT